MKEKKHASPLERFFSGLGEFIFHTKLGVADVQLVDYINDMLMRFVRFETSQQRIRKPTGQPATDVLQMLMEAEKRIGLAKREGHRHIGDFTLFWSGMYPESLRGSNAGVPDCFRSYCLQGKRAYRVAADIEGGQDRPPSELLHRLSEQFELCAYGLREVRRQWEEEAGDGGGLLVQ